MMDEEGIKGLMQETEALIVQIQALNELAMAREEAMTREALETIANFISGDE